MDAQFQRYRQVAIFVSALDRDAADTVLGQLSDEEATAVRRAILSLDHVTDEEQTAALNEFMRRGGKSTELPVKRGKLDVGVELDAGLSAKLRTEATPRSGGHPFHDADTLEVTTRPRPCFSCLADIDVAWLAPLMASEHPQTIAVVVSHLTQPQAAQFLETISPSQQTEVLRRLADLDEMDGDSLRLIEHHLEERLSEQLKHKKRRTAGVSNVAAILRAADPLTRNRLVKQLRQTDQQLAEQLKENTSGTQSVASTQVAGLTDQVVGSPLAAGDLAPASTPEKTLPPYASNRSSMLTEVQTHARCFDDFAHWTERALKVLLRECEPELILLALTGASEPVVRRVLEMFPARQEATLRHALKHPGPTRISDVEAAQQEILQLAVLMEQEGRLAPHAKRLSMAA